MKRRLEDWAYWNGLLERRRTAVVELYEGRGVGSESQAAAGTSWGLYNAVAELENYRTWRGDESLGRGVLFGERGMRIAQAFKSCLEIARN